MPVAHTVHYDCYFRRCMLQLPRYKFASGIEVILRLVPTVLSALKKQTLHSLVKRKVSMSRIGKLPLQVPAGVTITVDSDVISVKGAKGELTVPHLSDVTVALEEGNAVVTRNNEERIARAQHGLQRALLNNAVIGVSQGFEKKLEVNGVGFRVASSNNELTMSLGFSHEVKYKAPAGVNVSNDKMTIIVSGIDKQQVGQVAADIRSLKKPEPYKGKGIKYADEVLLRKAGKTGK